DFDARRLAVGGDVVVVTVNYQLGVFGFFGYPGLAGSGGFSLEDQQAALRWVQRNAAAFGGDPGNVTLFGESSGAMNTCAHLTSPSAAGLFQRAIVQSGSCLMTLPANSTFPGVPAASIWATSEEAATLGAVLAGEAGCDEPATAINCLKALSPSELLRTSTAMGFGRAAYGNDVLPRHPAEALQTGQFQRVPVMIGTTRDEATYFIAGFTDPPIDKAYYQELLIDAFGDDAKEIGRVYASTGYDLPALAWAAVITDNAWICPTLDAAHLLAKHVPVYAYEFADANALLFFPASGFPMGAFHGSELTYLFDILDWDPELTAEQERLANQMIQYWANFARAGDPNGPGLPDWTRFQNTDPESYV
ncbi:MAG: carboxylesterase family protein, partial [Thermomicrobiales bacterium]